VLIRTEDCLSSFRRDQALSRSCQAVRWRRRSVALISGTAHNAPNDFHDEEFIHGLDQISVRVMFFVYASEELKRTISDYVDSLTMG
jgi:hypothetical protein